MVTAVWRNTTLILGLLVAGLLGVMASDSLRSGTGGPAVGVLHAEVVPIAAVSMLFWIALAVIVAVIATRLVNAAVGLFILGGGIFVVARRAGTIEDLLFSGGSLTTVTVETALWSAVLLGMTCAAFHFGGPLSDVEPDEFHRRPHPFLSRAAVVSALAGVLVLPVIWAIAQTPIKGQMLAAVFLAAMVSGMAARLLSPHVQPILIFATPCLFGAIGHALGAMMVTGTPVDAYISGRLSAFNLPMPLDYAAGTLLGVSFGLGWAKSFLHHDETSSPREATAG